MATALVAIACETVQPLSFGEMDDVLGIAPPEDQVGKSSQLAENTASSSVSVPPAAEHQTTDNEVYEAAMIPLPEDNKEDFPNVNAPPAADAITEPTQTKTESITESLASSVPGSQESQPEEVGSIPESKSELDVAAGIPLPSDEPELSFERLSGLQSIEELKTVFIDLYINHYLAYKREGKVYGVLIPNQVMSTRDSKTGEVSGILVDCEPLHYPDPLLTKLRNFEDIPRKEHMALDFESQWVSKTKQNEATCYYRHDAESIFYLWLQQAGTCKFPNQGTGQSVSYKIPGYLRHSWFWDSGNTFSNLSRGSKAVEAVWTSLWKLVGDAYFLSRNEKEDETLNGHFTPEKVLEAIGVDAESLASTVADGESDKEFISDSD